MLQHDANNDESNVDETHHEHGSAVAPAILRLVPRPFRFDHAPIEASGLALDIYGRGAVIMSSLFLGPALLELAYDAAGCKQNDDEVECEAKIYGFRPSSLLSNIAIVAGLLASVLLPLFGAIVDHTQYRRPVGAYTAAALTVVKGVEMMVGATTWFYVAMLQVVSSLLYNFHITATYAYTSELSSDGSKQSEYNSAFFVILYVSCLLFMIEVLTVAGIAGTDDIGTARISQGITATTAAICFSLAWKYLFRDRPALSQVPHGMNLVTCGFRKILQTFTQIHREHRALQRLMLSVMFAEAASGALITIATTYMKDVLRLDSTEIGSVLLVVLLMGVPGSKLGGYLAVKLRNPVASAQMCNAVFIGTTSLASYFLTGPEDKGTLFIFGAFWGLCISWQGPVHVASYISIIPAGQQAELMGIYLLCGQVLAWLPPLLFTVLNEYEFPMAWGLASLNIFFGLALACLFCLGDYNSAVAHVRDGIELSAPHDNASEHPIIAVQEETGVFT
jgi:MFS-type transporter involved in bile tolerance (Atg22 family)